MIALPGIELISFDNRLTRHVIFWLSWIFGFTFIKSLGAPLEEYLGWFVYYIVTLPVFVLHTYLVVYWLIPGFLKGWKIALFVILFIVMVAVFSIMELLLSHELLARWLPEIFLEEGTYMNLGNIMISGIGNLYILLVFISAKMIRSWYLSREEKKQMHHRSLKEVTALNNLYIQPDLLMHTIDMLEKEIGEGKKDVTPAIAVLSELLNGLISMKNNSRYRFDDELKLVRLLLDLHAFFNGRPAVRLLFEGREGQRRDLPAMLTFSLIERFLRTDEGRNTVKFLLEPGFSPFLLSMEAEGEPIDRSALKPLRDALKEGVDRLFPNQFMVQVAELSGNKGVQISVKSSPRILVRADAAQTDS